MDIMFELEAAKLGHSWRVNDYKLDHIEKDSDGSELERWFSRPCTCGAILRIEKFMYSEMSIFELFHRSLVEHVVKFEAVRE